LLLITRSSRANCLPLRGFYVLVAPKTKENASCFCRPLADRVYLPDRDSRFAAAVDGKILDALHSGSGDLRAGGGVFAVLVGVWWRDFVAIVIANLASFLIGEVVF